MKEYIIIATFLVILTLTWDKSKSKFLSKLLLLGIAICSIFIVGCRYNIGADWAGYVSHYYTGYAPDKASGEIEFAFSIIRKFFYNIGLSHAVFLAFLSFLSLFQIFKASKLFSIQNTALVYLVYFSLFFLNYQFNIVRHGVLASCVFFSYATKVAGKNKQSLFWAILGCGFHSVGILFLVLWFVIGKAINKKYLIVGVAASFAICVLGIGERIVSMFPVLLAFDRLSGYLDTDIRTSYGISLGMLFNIALFLFFLIKRYDEYLKYVHFRVLMNALFFGIVFSLSLNAFGAIVGRVANLLNLSLIFLWPLFFEWLKNPDDIYTTKITLNKNQILNRQLLKEIMRLGLAIFFTAYLILYFNKSLKAEDLYGNLTMIPYKSKTEQLINSNIR